ncbi:hypothetical protein BVRB_8g195940 [Beta vulgaris subsp. vulgaris]|nr:hypothetical protein BVRB_8g195940 [Beta vulgaris subsp. vulgaris]
MADLENLLLEAAGRTGGSGRSRHSAPPSRRRQQLPLVGYAHHDYLYKDEDDRQQLAQLTELERELILSDRATKLDDKKLHERVKSRCTSARTADGAAHKADALNELRAKRMRQSQGIDAARKTFPSAGLSSSSESEDGRSKRARRMDDKSNIPTYEDIRGITIRRSKLAKWLMEPYFEDLIVGCFVRVGIGMKSGKNIYRLCIVRNVDASEPDRQYKLENKMTYKYLNCVWGSESSAARWQMATISDAPPLEEEYNQWKKEVERTSGRMATKQEVAEKKEEIEKTNSFVYSAETVKHMLQEKKSVATRPLNIAAEKEKLKREMEAAQYRNDEAQVEKIKARLEELAAVRLAQDNKNSKAHRLSEMNKKNRVENFKNAYDLKPVNTNLKSGEAGYDPFSRRWTKSTNYYAAAAAAGIKNKANGEVAEITEIKGGEKSVVVATVAAALEAATDAGKLVDQGIETNLLHNFDLPISLNTLHKFGWPQGVLAGFMTRKQRIEATIGLQVPENDGRRHALILSVSDYKRRRGWL